MKNVSYYHDPIWNGGVGELGEGGDVTYNRANKNAVFLRKTRWWFQYFTFKLLILPSTKLIIAVFSTLRGGGSMCNLFDGVETFGLKLHFLFS